MTSTDYNSSLEEFRKTYENSNTPALPERLSGYRFISYLSESEHKKAWLLEKPDGQYVLCKYASGEYVSMLQTEGGFFRNGKFPFIPYVLDYFTLHTGLEEEAYLIREYIEGQTLEEVVEKNGPLSLEEAVPLVEKLCRFLSRFHAADPPIIYRDLKPSNIILHPSGDIYLVDMGTARIWHEENSSDTVCFGTIDTAAPEQFGAKQTDNRTDIYSLGVLFYYLLTGEFKIRDSELKKLPSKYASIIRKCAAFDPDNRYENVSMVIDAMHDTAHSVKRSTRIAAVSVCAGFLVLALFLLGRFLLFRKPSQISDNEVNFSSALLEQAIREELGKTDGEPVYESDLSQITKLYICGDTVYHTPDEHSQIANIHSINGIHHSYGDISDISLLSKMTNLHYLTLDYQNIYDISPLADLSLVSLSLCGNPISDFSALQEYPTLSELYLSETIVSSLDFLSGCRYLSLLDCSYSPIASLEPIADLPIQSLYCSHPADLNILIQMPITTLWISELSHEHFDSLAEIPTLDSLSLRSCNIASLDELPALSQLRLLDLLDNDLSDLDKLPDLFPYLQVLALVDNPLTDLSPLADMTQLIYLGIDESCSDMVYETVPEPWFEIGFVR